MTSLIHKTMFAFILLLSVAVNSQSLHSYEYIIVPEQFEFQKKKNQYDINKLTQFLFNKYNFKAFIKGEIQPKEISICDALQATITAEGFLTTKLTLKLQNCQGQVVYTSQEGTSRKKDYKEAYQEATRNIFNDLRLKGHKYTPVKKNKVNTPKKPLATNIDKSTPVKPIQGTLKGKRTVKTPAKATGPLLLFKLRDKEYTFKPLGENYIIIQAGNTIGEALLNQDNISYTLKAKTLSGTGIFDDYGNFELNRINPLTKKAIKDTLARMN